MSDSQTPVAVGANPFSRWAVLSLVLLGSALFVALLWMIATGSGFESINDGQAHADGRGLNGYAAMALYLEKRGYDVDRARTPRALAQPGLLVLTPPAAADGKEIEKIVSARRYIGPTLVITPKWMAIPPDRRQQGAKRGWVNLRGIVPPRWEGFLDDLSVSVAPLKGRADWQGAGISGTLPRPGQVMSGAGTRLVRLIAGGGTKTLAGYMDDGGRYPGLEAIAQDRVLYSGEEEGPYPLVLVFEPDLLNNYGMARFANARLAEALVRAMEVKPGERVTFDITLNGFGRTRNLLTLAFTPPFLAATLCLLMAALVLGWRAFLRFGPPLATGRAIAFGKRALVANSAGLVRKSRRLHLIGGPYADHARERLVHALALPRTLSADEADAAIDRALASRRADAEPFSAISARLRRARRPHDLVKAACDLHALERMLTR